MKEQIIQEGIKFVFAILSLVASYGIAQIGIYFAEKRKALISKTGVDQYNANLGIAKNIYYVVEQLVKIGEVALEDRANKFDELLLKKIPHLSKDDLLHFRETVLGEVHSAVIDSKVLEPAVKGEDNASFVNALSQITKITPVVEAPTTAPDGVEEVNLPVDGTVKVEEVKPVENVVPVVEQPAISTEQPK